MNANVIPNSRLVLKPLDVFIEQTSKINTEALNDLIELLVSNGRLDILVYLHSNEQNLLWQEERLLMLATESGRLEVLTYLHQMGANLHKFQTVLVEKAIFYNHLNILKYLHQNGCTISLSSILKERLLTSTEHAGMMEYMHMSGLFNTAMSDKALLLAIQTKKTPEIKNNIENINLHENGNLFFLQAAKRGSVEIAQLLIARGITVEESQYKRVIVTAISAQHTDFVKWFLQHYSLSDEDINYAFKFSAINGHIDQCFSFISNFKVSTFHLSSQDLALVMLNGHVEVFDLLTDAGFDGIAEHRKIIEQMTEEISSAKSIYHPSKFWDFFNTINMEQLRRFGINRFKRSVNQNYFNYVPTSLHDKKITSLGCKFLVHPAFTIFGIRIKKPDRYLSGNSVSEDRQIFKCKKSSQSSVFFAHKLYCLMVGMLWQFAKRTDTLQLTSYLSEPTIGSPIETWNKEKLISQDLANSIIESNFLLQEFDTSHAYIAEIGAGYGRVGDVLLASGICAKYVVFDIPPSLYVAQWYLSQRYPGKRIFVFRHFDNFEEIREEFESAEIAFFTINQIESIPDKYFDIVINISSLHEMQFEQLNHLLNEIYRISNQRVYLKQYREYANPIDNITVTESAYFIPSDWIKKQWSIDEYDSRNFQALLIRSQVDDRNKTKFLNKPTRCRPTIAILLANYNDARFLRTALCGMFNQTDSADEIILVDDGSIDDSKQIMFDAQKKHANVRIISYEHNMGQHHAIQRALLESKCDYIVWAAADDLLLPDFIAANREALAQYPEAGLSFSRLATFQDAGSGITEYTEKNHGVAFDLGEDIQHYAPIDLVEKLRKHYLWISSNTVVVRRSLLINMGGFSSQLKWHGDWFTYYAIALRSGVVSIPKTLAIMRERPNTYSRIGMNHKESQKKVLSSLLDTLKTPSYLDLIAIFRMCPSLFSPFGTLMLTVGLSKIKYWRLIIPLVWWYTNRRLLRWKDRLNQSKGTAIFRRIISGVRYIGIPRT